MKELKHIFKQFAHGNALTLMLGWVFFVITWAVLMCETTLK